MTMWNKFSWHRLDTMREGEFVVYLSNYELLNKDIAPRMWVTYERRCLGKEWWRWWRRLGCRPFLKWI